MADVRCPMCGKSNPADREVCQFCSARLKPLVAPGQEPGQAAPAAGSDVPDWLRSLQNDASTGGDALEAESENSSETGPDWLSRIRDRAKTEGVQPEEPALPGWGEEPAEQDVPDWLSGLRDEREPSSPAPAADDDAGWLGSIRGEQSAANSGAPESNPAPSSNDDWLASLGGGAFNDAPESSEEAPQASSENAFDAGSIFTGTPDWLSGSETAAPGSEDSNTPGAAEPFSWGSEASGGQDTPQWNTPAGDSAADSSAPAFSWNDSPDEPPSFGEPAVPSLGGETLPDWLSGAAPDESASSRAQSFQSPEPSEQDMPDWLSSGSAPANADSLPDAVQGDLPDWLSAPTAAQPPAGDALPADSGDLPDWLGGAAASAAAGASEGKQEFGDWRSGDKPDWLSNMEAAAGDSQAPETPPSSQEEGLPAWLSSTSSGTDSEPALPASEENEPAGEPEALPAEDLPDWLRASQPESPSQPAIEQPAEEPFARENLDWLANMPQSSESQPPAAHEQQESDEISLAPAELPNWVQAMRPVESVTPTAPVEQAEADERVERSGPLAGLQGVLPVEALIAPMKKPGLYSSRLQVSEQQQVNMALMESIIASETEPQPAIRQKPFPAQTLLRLGIGLILLVAVVLGVLGGGGFTESPGILPTELAAVNNAIERLPADAPVLVAVEYQSALSGELEAAAASSLASLLNRSAYVALVSTNPTGPALAEHLIDTTLALSSPAGFNRAQRVVNLGYLSGGPAGLLSFALQPQSTLPFSTAMQPAWDSGSFLQNVRSLADFQQVILITDSANTARDWVEQVKPSMGSQPLYVISSAQSAPMISPYLDTGQVAGMVSGLSGGTVFEEVSGRHAAGFAYWDAYQAGIVVMIILILVGGIIGLAKSMANPEKDSKDRA